MFSELALYAYLFAWAFLASGCTALRKDNERPASDHMLD
jgi:hypothetical protein